MSLQVVLEVTSPYHVNGREVLYSPGHQFPAGTVLPPDVRVIPVVADVPDPPVKPAAVPAKRSPDRE
jgi:hypothetical protein